MTLSPHFEHAIIRAMRILGISCYYHDAAAALIVDGRIVAAAQEERFTRKKHDDRFPKEAVAYCLKEGGITIDDVDIVAFYDRPFLKFERLLETYVNHAPRGYASFRQAMPLWLKDKFWMVEHIKEQLAYKGKLVFTEHHQAHAASAFFPSPFDEAAILTVDGVGEWATSSWGVGKGNKLEFREEIHFPNSLGLLYSAFTYYTGFRVNSGEYKVMGLAPYGEPKYVDHFRKFIDIKDDGSFALDMSYFNYEVGLTMTSQKLHELFGGPPRKPESLLTQKEMDIAASLQMITEEVMLKMARHVHKMTGMKNLCLAGGVALNCVANGRLLREGPFEDIWIQPAAGDAGGALGAALSTWYEYLRNARVADGTHDAMQGSYLGPQFSNEEIRKYCDEKKIVYDFVGDDKKLFADVSGRLADGAVIGWFSGRMEFGPRALGSRSIIGDARNTEMQSKMNLKIKFRESFRPFAPSVLAERADDYFMLGGHQSPYMLLTAMVVEKRRKQMTKDEEKLWGIAKLNIARSDIPAVTHVDYSARVQTVAQDVAPRYHALLKAFYEKTGCPVLVNTSFNVRGEPIVCTPEDAFRCFMRTDMDYLVLENFIIDKKAQQKMVDNEDWQKTYELD